VVTNHFLGHGSAHLIGYVGLISSMPVDLHGNSRFKMAFPVQNQKVDLIYLFIPLTISNSIDIVSAVCCN
jgi:hypothetical protein